MEEKECCEICLYYNTENFKCQCKNSEFYNKETRCDNVCEKIEI